MTQSDALTLNEFIRKFYPLLAAELGISKTEERLKALIDICVAAVLEADNGDYYAGGSCAAYPIEEALKALGIIFGPETNGHGKREVTGWTP